MMKFRKNPERTRGYAVVFVALIMIPLLGFTSFAVDLGSWYAQGAKMQQVADAAALGGAVFLPNKNRAIESARQIVEANGYRDGIDGVEIDVTVSTDARRIKVDLFVDDLPRFFSQVLFRNLTPEEKEANRVTLKRTSIAEFVPQPKVGSARNYIGTGNCPFGNWGSTNSPFGFDGAGTCNWPSYAPYSGDASELVREGWQLNNPPQCGGKGQHGLRYSASTLAITNRYPIPGGGSPIEGAGLKRRCSPGPMTAQDQYSKQVVTRQIVKNPEYRKEGDYFGIVVPPGQSVRVEGFHIGHGELIGSTCTSLDISTRSNIVDIKYTVIDNGAWDPRSDLVPGHPVNPALGAAGKFTVTVKRNCTVDYGGSNVTYQNGWMPITPVLNNPTTEEKIYWMEVEMGTARIEDVGLTQEETDNSVFLFPTNRYSLRLVTEGTPFMPCSSDPQESAIYSDNCPSIYGVETINAGFLLGPREGQAAFRDFYLAEFGENQIGNTVSVEIFDADWGSKWMAILPPNPQARGTDSNSENFYQEFKPYILCVDGSLAENEKCRPLTGNVQEVPPLNVDLGVPAGTENSGVAKYDMPKGKKFYLFRGPTPFSPSVFNANGGVGQGTIMGPNNTNTWYTVQGNIPGWNVREGGTAASGYATTAENSFSTWTNANEGEFRFGVGSRTVRMDFVVGGKEETGASASTGYWWKLRFFSPARSQGGSDGMTWTIRTIGEPVRLVPNIYDDVNWN